MPMSGRENGMTDQTDRPNPLSSSALLTLRAHEAPRRKPSAVGVGSIFTLWLPVAPTDAN